LSIHKKVAHYKEKSTSGSSTSRGSSVSSDKDKNTKGKQDVRQERRTPDKAGTGQNFPKKEPFDVVEIRVPSYTASHLRTPNHSNSTSVNGQLDRKPSPNIL
jgi:hypothetical protein